MTDAPIQIRNPDVVRDIRALADRLGLPMTDVVAEAVRRRLSEEDARAAEARSDRKKRALEVLARIDALPRSGALLTDTDLYDADGFPKDRGP
ncbi:MAG: type II toxin-antitoxin system VapB family antitoxin [Caulobacterales bacterium]|jgi:hypothetical protein